MPSEYNEDHIRQLEEEVIRLKEANRALTARESQLRAMFDLTPNLVIRAACEGALLDVNPSGMRMFEAESLEGIIGRSLFSVVMPEFRDAVRGLAERVCRGEHATLEFQIAGLKGTPCCLSMYAVPQWDEALQKTTMLGIAVDTTVHKRAEQSLRKIETRWRLAADRSNTGMWDWDLLTNEVYFSPIWKRQIGYADDEAPNSMEFWKENLHPDDVERTLAQLAACLEKPWQRYESEFRLRHKNGSYRWILSKGSLLADEKGRQVRMLGSHVDITERKNVEEQLRLSEERYRSLVEVSPDAILIHRDGRFRFVNQAAVRLFKAESAAQIVGQPLHDFIAPEHHELLGERIATMVSTGKPAPIVAYRLICCDGTSVWGDISATPFFDVDGSSIQVVVHDITERRKLEQHRRVLSRAIEQTTEAVIISDHDSRIIYANPAFERVSGFSSGDVEGKHMDKLLRRGKTPLDMLADIRTVINAGNSWSGNMALYRKDGTTFEGDVSVTPLRDSFGRTLNFVAVGRDITRERQLERQFQQAQKMEAIGRLAGGVAHDFNNLLTIMIACCDLLAESAPANTESHRRIADIQQACDRAKSLTLQLLTFSRKHMPTLGAVRINDVVADTSKLLRHLIGEDVELETMLQSDLPAIYSDNGQVGQIIMNLAVNARDAMPNGGRLVIRTLSVDLDQAFVKRHSDARPGLHVLLEVSDSGSGMDSNTLALLFEPFFTTKGAGQGTGLGLSTVYGIVKKAGGFITVSSEVGFGTTFKIYLPAIVAPIPVEDAPVQRSASAQRQRIVLVEDDSSLRTLITAVLDRAGFSVIAAANGEEVLGLGPAMDAPDLLLTDIVMPGMNGFELSREFLKMHPSTKVLFMSGYTDDRLMPLNMEDVSADYIQKPFTREQLVTKILHLFAGPVPQDA
jgi:two-component system, cell cycle sensor histidine kinase and response regulator CckA